MNVDSGQPHQSHQLDAAQLRILLTLSRDLMQTDDAGMSFQLIGQSLFELVRPDTSLLLLRAGNVDLVGFDEHGHVQQAGQDHPLYEAGMRLLPDIEPDAHWERRAAYQCARIGPHTVALAVPAYAAVAVLVADWRHAPGGEALDQHEGGILAILELASAALGKIEAYAILQQLVGSQRAHIATSIKAHAAELAQRDEAMRALGTLSLTDVLTGLYNRRGFFVQAEHLYKVAHRRRARSAVIFADIDGLKRVNDELGHERGDAAIRDAAMVFRQSFRQADVVARLGGDEFVAYTLDDEDPGVILGRIHANLAAFNLMEERPFALSMSTGIVQCDLASNETLSDYLLRADERMYAQKRSRLH